MAERRTLVLTATGFVTVLAFACLWLMAVDGYARTFMDAAAVQFICRSGPSGPMTPKIV